MKKLMTIGAIVCLASAAPASAQLGQLGKRIGQAQDAKKTMDDLTFSDAEEQQIGSEISAKLREKYGVVQDKAVHRYVSLVGGVLAQASSRPNLKWTFIVLDTDGVNAFAAPGGFIHITRGAMALIKNEAELADVLGHEIGHVTAKHTLNAIQKAGVVSKTSEALPKSEITKQVVNRAYGAILENSYDRKDEIEADKLGVTSANQAGYAPSGLESFLTRLADRNKDLKDRSGMFASHPEAKARLDALNKVISGSSLKASSLVATRYTQSVSFKPVPVTAVPQGAPAAPAAAAAAPPASSGGGKLGLGGLSALGREKSSSDTVSSAGSRGVNPDRDAKGGPVKTLVPVSITAAEIAEFRKGITG
ncbi:MAG: M48 family metalloprotease [Vicinamibacterales bacterium]